LLLAIESFDSMTAWYSVPSIVENKFKNKYSLEEVCYTVLCLKEAGYIEAQCTLDIGAYSVRRLTWSGHEFLDNIRDAKPWAAAKKESC
jgi:hypothetical protein